MSSLSRTCILERFGDVNFIRALSRPTSLSEGGGVFFLLASGSKEQGRMQSAVLGERDIAERHVMVDIADTPGVRIPF
jgi:hypothetical protein